MHEQMPYNEQSNYDLIEFVENPQPRCPYIILVDSSGSMDGEPINELNEGLKLFKKELMKNELASKRVELAVISFDSEIKNLTDGFVSPKNFQPVEIEAGGVTRMCEAIKLAHSLIEIRKQQYKDGGVQYYRPWIVLITDGVPTDPEGYALDFDSPQFTETANIVRLGNDAKKFSFFAIGVGNDVDMDALSRISSTKRPPKKLSGLKFKELFQWLSDSASTRSSSTVGTAVALAPTDGWTED